MLQKLLERELGGRARVRFDDPPPARFAVSLSVLLARNPRLRLGVLLGFSWRGELLFCHSRGGVMQLDLLALPSDAVVVPLQRLTLGRMEDLSEVSVEVRETEDVLVCGCFTAALLHLTIFRRGWRESLSVTLFVTQRPSFDVAENRVAVCCGADVFVWELTGDRAAEELVRWPVAGAAAGAAAGGARLVQSVSVEELAGRARARLGAAVAEDFEASLGPGGAAAQPLSVCCTVRLRPPAPPLLWLRAECMAGAPPRLAEARAVRAREAAAPLPALHAALLRTAERAERAPPASRLTGSFAADQTRSVGLLAHPVFPGSIVNP